MTGQAMARRNGVTADTGPAPGSAWQPPRPGLPRPLQAGWLTLVTLPTSPFWARRYTRTFLDSCRESARTQPRRPNCSSRSW
jgi:hypothetical protein